MREYPNIPTNLLPPIRPISFICVKFSNEFDHNILVSECIHNPLNEFIVVDNTSNIFFATLGQAINSGISKAKHDLLVIVHEDVVLMPGWQSMFELSLMALESEDPNWLVAGVVGWDNGGNILGHFSEPQSNRNTFTDAPFAEVTRIDEQVLVLRKSKGLLLDPNIPSIHHIGRDLPLEASYRGLKAYILNAPSIHKYADADGKLIQTAKDSSKIQDRSRLPHLAERACSSEYIKHKWSINKPLDRKMPGKWGQATPPETLNPDQISDPAQEKILNSPIILLGKGGGGSRLLSTLARDINLFIGNDINVSGDSLEMARSIYRAIVRKYRCPSENQKQLIVPDIRATAAKMLKQANWPKKWGFKLPENVFVLPELSEAFSNASYVFFRRDPLTTTLGRTHLTASLDNPIGQITLTLAYDSLSETKTQLLTDGGALRMAKTTAHQLDLIMGFRRYTPEEKWLDLKFEELNSNPESLLQSLADFCGSHILSNEISEEYNPNRALILKTNFSAETITEVTGILAPIRARLGYKKEPNTQLSTILG